MKKIAYRIDQWTYGGNNVGNIWLDINDNKKFWHIQNLLDKLYTKDKISEVIINYESGEIFVNE